MGKTSIEWCDFTFNPWIGCTRVSAACDFCYAEALARRYGWAKWGAGKARRRTSAENWLKPLKWNRAAQAAGKRAKVFCASLADVFDTEVPDEWRDELFAYLIMATPWLDWLLLTKRPKKMAEWAAEHGWPENCWAGTTTENYEMACARIPYLLAVPAPVHFLSYEPALGPLNFSRAWMWPVDPVGIDWVICGGESGPNARYMEPQWARDVRDACGGEVAFFMKQMTKKAPIPDDLMIRQFPEPLPNSQRGEA